MTQEQKRIKIAEACGWKWAHKEPDELPAIVEGWLNPVTKNLHIEPSDYFNDLNACHEMEKVLTHKQWSCYIDTLIDPYSPDWQTAIHATAAQRSEAFGRTLKLWDTQL